MRVRSFLFVIERDERVVLEGREASRHHATNIHSEILLDDGALSGRVRHDAPCQKLNTVISGVSRGSIHNLSGLDFDNTLIV